MSTALVHTITLLMAKQTAPAATGTTRSRMPTSATCVLHPAPRLLWSATWLAFLN